MRAMSRTGTATVVTRTPPSRASRVPSKPTTARSAGTSIRSWDAARSRASVLVGRGEDGAGTLGAEHPPQLLLGRDAVHRHAVQAALGGAPRLGDGGGPGADAEAGGAEVVGSGHAVHVVVAVRQEVLDGRAGALLVVEHHARLGVARWRGVHEDARAGVGGARRIDGHEEGAGGAEIGEGALVAAFHLRVVLGVAEQRQQGAAARLVLDVARELAEEGVRGVGDEQAHQVGAADAQGLGQGVAAVAEARRSPARRGRAARARPGAVRC